MNECSPEGALAEIAKTLSAMSIPFALVGGLAVSIRAEVRFTRDVDVAIGVNGDDAVGSLVQELRGFGYRVLATVEHEERNRLATVRLLSELGVVVDLIAASCGIENEIVAAAIPEHFSEGMVLPVARAEDLLAMKVLSMTDRRLQDRIDARNLISIARCDLDDVRARLRLIEARGFQRGQDLQSKLASVIIDAERERI